MFCHRGYTDPDFEENFLKPELIKMITRMFPTYFEDMELERFTLRDKIIQSIKLANEVRSIFIVIYKAFVVPYWLCFRGL